MPHNFSWPVTNLGM